MNDLLVRLCNIRDIRQFLASSPGGLQSIPRVKGQEIHIWYYTGKSILRAEIEKYSYWLDESENKRVQTRVRPLDRDEFISSHLFLRKVLSLYTGISPGDIVFPHHPSGKPFMLLPTEKHFFFSMSRSAGAIAVGVSRSIEMGIDLERIDEDMPWKEMASSHFPPGEAEIFKSHSDPLETFYRYWTLREAALKYLGTGLSVSPEKVKVSIPQEGGETFSIITFSSVGFSDILTGVSVTENDFVLSLVFKAERGAQYPELEFR